MRGRAIALLLLAGCRPGDSAPDSPAAVSVGVQPVVEDSISEVISVSGRLTALPGGSALLTASADAVVQQVAVQLGDRVRSGQLLLRLDAPELTTAAAAMAAQAHSDSLDLARQRSLYEQGITSRKQLEEREAAAAGSSAQADAARSLLARARVTSPIGGGVQRLLVQTGERVAAGQPLVEIVNGTALDFHAGVPAGSLARLRLGQPVSLLAEGPDHPVIGRLVAIAPAIDSTSGMGEIVVRVSAPDGLRAGSSATGTILLQRIPRAIVVPDSALVPGEGGLRLFVVGPDSIARARAVSPSVRTAGRAAVTGDVKPGDLVVVSGAYGLTDSTRVKPIAQP
jgi:RND family efflux transporter MFP subunit